MVYEQIDDGDASTPVGDTGRLGRSKRWLATGVLVSLVLVGVGVAADRNAPCSVPDVTGMSLSEADVVLRQSGLLMAGQSADVTSVASEEPEDVVLEQTASCEADPIRLLVSDGGPVTTYGQLPAEARQLLGPMAVHAPVRVITTPDGTAWKSDDYLVGPCDVVERSESFYTLGDAQYDTRCY